MGFYGNITNTSKTQFQFDKTYSSRYDMDLHCGSDGVYPGRYVLVEYGQNETVLRTIFLNDGVPFSGLNSHPYTDGVTEEIVNVYVQPPDENLKYKVINPETYYEKNPDADSSMTINAGDLVAVPPGRRLYNLNKEVKYIQFTNIDTKAYVITDESAYNDSQEKLHDYVTKNNLLAGKTWEEYKEKTHVHNVNGKIIFGAREILAFRDYPDGIESIVWKINIGGEYWTNEYTTYFIADVTNAIELNGEYTNVQFLPVSGTGAETPYITNHNLDKAFYNTSRGYDSTVWQKTFVNGIEKYVMIAELNSVVPTFSIVNDAPTLIPITPHFDGNSTNIYYRLHWQPSWAIRTKASNPTYKVQSISQQGVFSEGGIVETTKDSIIYPSDQDTIWKGSFYNTIENKVTEQYFNTRGNRWEEKNPKNELAGDYIIPAAIYYNKDGFRPDEIYSSDLLITERPEEKTSRYNENIAGSGWNPDEDRVGFFPTGQSGHMYNNHDDSLEGQPQVDTQEFVLMLPSIGNTISSIWDLIFGGRKTNTSIDATLKRNQNIEWEDGLTTPTRLGLRLRGNQNGYNTAEVNTVAGAINSVHDLMGMIITEHESLQSLTNNIENLSMNKIYYANAEKDYYRKQLKYRFTPLAASDFNADGTLKKEVTYTEVGQLEDFSNILSNQNIAFFKDFNMRSGTINPLLADYIRENEYQKNQLYFRVNLGSKILIQDTYEPNEYFYLEGSSLLIDTELKPNTKNGEGFSKDYYKIVPEENKTIEKSFKTFPDEYPEPIVLPNGQMGRPAIGENAMHGVYRPNTYFYRDEATGVFKLDDSPNFTRGRAYFAFKAKAVDQDTSNPLYVMTTSYTPFKNPTVDTYEINKYFYIDKTYIDKNGNTIDITWAALSNKEVPDSAIHLATQPLNHYYNNATWLENMFTYDGTGLFTRTLTYTPSESVLYDLFDEPIVLKDFRENSIFQFIYGGILSDGTRELVGINFLSKEEIPVVAWEDNPNGDPTKLILLKPDSGEPYDEEDQPFYYLGLNDTVNSYPLVNLVNIDNGRVSPIVRIKNEFYQANKFHYIPEASVVGESRRGTILLDTRPNAQYKNSTDLIDYYELTSANITLIPDTFTEVKSNITYSSNASMDTLENLYYKDGNGLLHPAVPGLIENEGVALYRAIPLENKFYEPDKYYDANGNLYKDVNKPGDENTIFYKKKGIYVISDSANIYTPGAEWNTEASIIPATVTLGTRDEYYGMEVISNLARNENTIHGLILRLNKILESNNIHTRDTKTVQGSINALNDILARFDKLKSGEFVVVDEYGRYHSARFTTSQPYTAINHGNGATTTYESSEDRWIDLDVDPVYSDPNFTITHNFTAVTDTTTTADLNNTSAGDGNNKGNTNTLELYTPIVDNTGHVVGKNIETVTLPYGFKTITAANSDAVSTGASTITANNVIADNTQDTLALSASNKWIKLDTSTADSIKFGHYAGGFTKGAANTEYGLTASKTVADLDNGNSFIIPNFKFDEAGHIISAENQTISLPENFTKVTTTVATGTANSTAGTAGTIEADTLTDTLTLAEGNKWINIIADATNDKITFSHYVNAFSESTGTAVNFNNTGNSFTVVSDTTHDEAGHLTGITNTTFTLPNSLKTINIGAANNSVNFATASNTAIVADSPRASMSISPGNRWITLTSDGSAMTINHAAAGTADSIKADGINASQAPAFGGTFNIPTFGIDQAGHISTVGTKAVTLPSLPVLADSVLGGEVAINAFNSQIINGVATNAVTFDKDSSTLISIINSLITRINELEATIAILHP